MAVALDVVEPSDFTKRPGEPVTGILDQPGAVDQVIAAFEELIAGDRSA